jgi:Mg-chelatase subunit ChlD
MSNCTQGQTALGPAIVTALGIVSKHGQGSSIVVVTDGIGNKGIFDQT